MFVCSEHEPHEFLGLSKLSLGEKCESPFLIDTRMPISNFLIVLLSSFRRKGRGKIRTVSFYAYSLPLIQYISISSHLFTWAGDGELPLFCLFFFFFLDNEAGLSLPPIPLSFSSLCKILSRRHSI